MVFSGISLALFGPPWKKSREKTKGQKKEIPV